MIAELMGKRFFGIFGSLDKRMIGYVSIEDKLAITARIPSPSFIATKKGDCSLPKKVVFELSRLSPAAAGYLSHKHLGFLSSSFAFADHGFLFLHSLLHKIES
jgi:hypothetical protein